MHEKLVKQLRNADHCGGCPYNEDCNEFDSCLMDLLAADVIEDMNKRVARQEKELQEQDKYIENKEYLFGKDWQEERDIHRMAHIAASEIMTKIHRVDRSGELLYLFCKSLCNISKLTAYDISRDDEYKFVVITENEYNELKGDSAKIKPWYTQIDD